MKHDDAIGFFLFWSAYEALVFTGIGGWFLGLLAMFGSWWLLMSWKGRQ